QRRRVEQRLEIGQQPDSKAGLCVPGGADKLYGGGTAFLCPANCIGNGEQRLPYVGITVLDPWRPHRPCRRHFLDRLPTPSLKARWQCITLGSMTSPAIWGDFLGRRASPHPDDDGATKDRVWKPTEARQRHGAVGGDFLRHHLFAVHDAATSNSTAPVASI